MFMCCKKNSKRMMLFKLYFVSAFLLIFSLGKAQSSIDNSIKPENDSNHSITIPNIGISIIPPKYFKPSEKFPGFIHEGSASSITFSREEGTPYLFLNSNKIKESFVNQGIEFISKQKIKTNRNKHGFLYTLAFTIENIRFIRLLYITGDYNTIVIVNANYPEIAKDILHDVLIQSIRSVTFNSPYNE